MLIDWFFFFAYSFYEFTPFFMVPLHTLRFSSSEDKASSKTYGYYIDDRVLTSVALLECVS